MTEKTKGYLEKHGDDASTIDLLPSRFYENFILTGIRVLLIQPGRILCSLKVPARLLVRNFLSIHPSSLRFTLAISLSLSPPLNFYFSLILHVSLLEDRTRTIPCTAVLRPHSSIVLVLQR